MVVKRTTNDFLVPWTQYGIPWECKKNITTVSYFDLVSMKPKANCQVTWKANKPFKAGLELSRFVGSSDSMQIIVKHTENGQIFYMREADLFVALKKSVCVHGVLLGEWKAKVSVGRYYGLEIIL